jgi:hypothetical protein
MYRKIIVGLAALAALAVAGIAQSSASVHQSVGPDRLFGGGRFVYDFDPGPTELTLPRDISTEASSRNGRNSVGTRFYGRPERPTAAPRLSISCLGVEEHRAVIGVIDQNGNVTVQYFEDNGPPGPDLADRITPAFQPNPADAADVEQFMQLMGPRFPRVCPSTTPPVAWGEVWSTLDSGDIAVVDGG